MFSSSRGAVSCSVGEEDHFLGGRKIGSWASAPLIASYHLSGKAQFRLVSSDREKMSLEENLKAQTVDKMEKALDKGGGDL